jgi:ABC-type phosphate/phosphonate transport system substrate-binding protein
MAGKAAKVLFGIVVLFPALAFIRSSGAGENETETVHLGLVSTLFTDIQESTCLAMMKPFGEMMKRQTGVTGALVSGGDADTLAHRIAENKVQLGVFHGIEFAWLRARYPELRPLVIAVNSHRYLQTHVVVRNNASTHEWRDLENKTMALPPKMRQHCLLYLNRRCKDCKKTPATFFSKVVAPPSCADALDEIVEGTADATLAEAVVLDWYKEEMPGRYAKLRILETSERFPPGVIVYRPGILTDTILNKFRAGLINLNKTALGDEVLMLWRLSAFEPVPDDFEKTLSDIVKPYPPPADFVK